MTHAAKDAARFLKNTLRLPSTSFPPRPPPVDLAKYLPRCTDDLYSWQRRERPASNTFTLHDGPPYANGDLHVGHALNKILKDIINRWNLARGKRVDYVPGWDCHGLPIELKALEQHGWKKGQDVKPTAIRDAARAFAQNAISKQMDGFRSWAVMGDWNGHWETMHKDFEIRQLEVFKAMVEHGLIYRKRKPVYWSSSSGTALAEAELEYKDDHLSTAAYIKFPLRDTELTSEPIHALIWTTTPWTLPANQAIALNPSLSYVLVRSRDHGLLVLATSRLEQISHVLGEALCVVQQVPSSQLLDCTYDGLQEFGSRASNRPIIAADFVSADSGTGLVHCAPGHGMEDYQALNQLIQDGRVEVTAPVDGSGFFDADASPSNPVLLEGKHVFTEGNQIVLDWFERSGRLVHRHSYSHKYPIDWRTKEPVIIRATSQWFADLSNIKIDALQAIEKTSFMPESGKNRLRSFVENRTEWCISRQRSWGVPIPAIYHKDTNEAILTASSIAHIIGVIQIRGIDAWWSDAVDDQAWICGGLDASRYRRGTDTMDVWFDSGTTWTSMLSHDRGQHLPMADVNIEGTDQHRGWFQSSLLSSTAYQKALRPTSTTHAPFKTLITHGFTLDAQGKKMSKSLGNVISPAQIIAGIDQPTQAKPAKSSKKHREIHPLGPDALRLWVASSDWTKDVVVSNEVVNTVHTALDKYRVTIKLLLGLLKDFDPATALTYDNLSMLDQIALLQLHNVWSSVQSAYSDLEYHRAVMTINRWIVTDLSGFYFEAIKDISYCDSPRNPRRVSASTALHQIFTGLQCMLGPITPLLIEESWEHSSELQKTISEHPLRRVWDGPPPEWYNAQLRSLYPRIIEVNQAVKAAQEKARMKKLLGQSLACEVCLHMKRGSQISTVPVETLKEILVVSNVEIHEDDGFESLNVDLDSFDDRPWTRSSRIHDSSGERIGTAVVHPPRMEKCARCWKYVAEPVTEDELPLCARCDAVMKELA